MSKFEALTLSKTVAQHGNVINKKGFMGLFSHAVYKPTQSRIDSFRNYFSAEVGNDLFGVISAPAEETEQRLEAINELPSSDKGDFRMDLCLSRDHQFAALQLFRLQDSEYIPVSDIAYLEGNAAVLLEDKLI